MLPIGKMQASRDWMAFFTVLVWATVIFIMFLSKLKKSQDVMVMGFFGIMMLICNADTLFSHTRSYKVFIVLRQALMKDCFGAFALTLACLLAHGVFPEAVAPGIALHPLAVVAWLALGSQVSPLVSCGVYVGGRNQMTRTQLHLRVAAQLAGSMLALLAFAFWHSFALPGEGPFAHFFGLESTISSFLTFAATVGIIKQRDSKDMAVAKAAKAS